MNPPLYIYGSLALCLLYIVSLNATILGKRNIFMHSDLVYLVSVCVLLLATKICFLNGGIFNVDEGFYLSAGLGLLNDPRPWISVDPTTSGPINLLIPALVQWVSDSVSYGHLRIAYIVLLVIPTICLTFFATRTVLSSLDTRLFFLPLVLSIGFFNTPDLLHASSEQAPVLLIAVFYFAIVKTEANKASLWLSALLGALVWAGLFMKIQCGPILSVLALFYLTTLYAKKTRWTHYMIFVGISALTALGFFAYIYLTGAFEDFLQTYILGNLDYTESEGSAVVNFLEDVTVGLLPLLVLFFYVLIAKLSTKKAATIHNIVSNRKLWYFLVFTISVFCVVKPNKFYSHYCWFLILPAYWTIMSQFDSVWNNSRVSLLFLSAILTGLWIFNVREAKPLLYYKPNHPADIDILNYLKSRKKAGDKLTIWGRSNSFNFETKMVPGTRFVNNDFLFTMKRERLRYYEGRFLNDLISNRPKWYIHIFENYREDSNDLKTFPKIDRYFSENYTKVFGTANGDLYMLKQ